MFKKTYPNVVSDLKLKYIKKPIQNKIDIQEEIKEKDLLIKKNIMKKITQVIFEFMVKINLQMQSISRRSKMKM